VTPQEAHRARAWRRGRIVRIRKAVAVLAVAVFVAAFSTIYVQMALGRDPVLGAKAATSTGGSSAATSADSTDAGSGSSDSSSSNSGSSDSSSSDSGSSDSSSSTDQPSAVTTSQS
jgi:hypothetical protein